MRRVVGAVAFPEFGEFGTVSGLAGASNQLGVLQSSSIADRPSCAILGGVRGLLRDEPTPQLQEHLGAILDGRRRIRQFLAGDGDIALVGVDFERFAVRSMLRQLASGELADAGAAR